MIIKEQSKCEILRTNLFRRLFNMIVKPTQKRSQYFLTTLSSRCARGRFKEATSHYQLNDLYESFSTEMPDHTHLLPSILLHPILLRE